MVVMTPLTLYLALANPVSDCGCFGDAWVLTNWETFGKNVVLLVAAVSVFKWQELLVRFITPKMEWMVSMYTFLFVFALSFYCLDNLPILGFPSLQELERISRRAWKFRKVRNQVCLKAGLFWKKEESVRNLHWTIIRIAHGRLLNTRTVLKEKGYEPPIHDFSMMSLDTWEDITDSVLSDKGYTFLLVAHRIEGADDSNIDLINEIYDYSVEHGYGFYALTSSPEDEIELWRDKTGAEYPFCQTDDITLKTIIRSNPGLLLVKDGTILNKWSDNRLPDEYVLTDSLDKLELGKQKQESDLQTIGYVLLWFILPLTDGAWCRYFSRKAPGETTPQTTIVSKSK